MIFSGEEIYKIIPNRYPLMILNEIDVDEMYCNSKITLKKDDWFFECHFPNNPIMPFCLLLESMAQTFESIVCYKLPDKEIPITTRISNSNFRDSCTVGDTISINAELLKFKHGVAEGHVTAYKNINIIGEKGKICDINITQVIPSMILRINK